MDAARTSRRLDIVAAGGAGILAATLGLHPVITPDLWWHLASGRWILAHQAIPGTDPFTYPAAGHAWVNLQWLGDVAAVGIYRWSGADGLILLKMLGLAAVAVVLYVTARRAGAGPAVAAPAVALGMLAGAERTMVRPEIATYVLLAITLALAAEARAGRGWAALVPPALAALWINLHSLAFLAPFAIALHVLDPLGRRPAGNGDPGAPVAERDPAPRRLVGSAVASAVALLLNPYGVKAWTFPATLFRRIQPTDGAFHRILEFASPLDEPGDPALRFFWVLVALALAAVAVPGGRERARRLAFLAPFLALALFARRNIPLFAIAAVPVLAVSVAERLRAARPAPGWARAIRTLAILLPLLPAVALARGASPRLLGLAREPGLGVLPGLFPDACMAALERRDSPGQLFNDIDFGGYVTWCVPARRTFIDGRLEVAGAELLGQYIRAHEDPAAWNRVRRSWNIDTLLLDHTQRGSAAFLHALLESKEWTLLCASPEAVLLGARGTTPPPPDLRPPAETWPRILAEKRAPSPGGGKGLAGVAGPLERLVARSPSPAAVRRAVHLAGLCLQLGWLDEAREGYARVLDVAPDDPEALFNAGICDVRRGDPEAARARWTSALERVPAGRRARFRDALDRLPPES